MKKTLKALFIIAMFLFSNETYVNAQTKPPHKPSPTNPNEDLKVYLAPYKPGQGKVVPLAIKYRGKIKEDGLIYWPNGEPPAGLYIFAISNGTQTDNTRSAMVNPTYTFPTGVIVTDGCGNSFQFNPLPAWPSTMTLMDESCECCLIAFLYNYTGDVKKLDLKIPMVTLKSFRSLKVLIKRK